jgi:ABC-2 type transport system permease protein
VTSALVIARKELLDLRRNRFLLAILGFVLVAVVISVVVSATQFGAKLDAYNTYLDALHAAGNTTTPAAPQLFPLQLLRGSIEYLEILGALFAIVMGYGMIAKEKQRATLQLIYSRPIGRFSLPAGKLLALAVAWLIAVGVIFGAVTAIVAIVGHAQFAFIDAQRLLIAAATAWGYLLLWSALALGLAATTLRLGVAKLVPAAGGLPSRWQSYINRSVTPSITTPALASAVQATLPATAWHSWRRSETAQPW